ncbi:unnamed protein product [Phytophthora lilii]|uniref:Unnamed protein product n=1 Tax=Phytophthora lilii TaxID=2077276 RepID=A0A9W6X3J5_9STRA|nr:unnamed protein product [Phytophthora lilii]
MYARSCSFVVSMSDFYGFTIPDSAREDWVHLRSYQDCREERRVEDWTRLYGTQFPERLQRCSYKEKDTGEKELLMELARAGIPRHLRERAYMNLSRASEKKANAGPDYYVNLLAEELEFSDVQALLVDHATRASGRAQLASWLASIGLVVYAPTFFDEGFDDATFLLGTGGLDDKTLDAMHIQKAGHRAKLQSLYQLKEFLQV